MASLTVWKVPLRRQNWPALEGAKRIPINPNLFIKLNPHDFQSKYEDYLKGDFIFWMKNGCFDLSTHRTHVSMIKQVKSGWPFICRVFVKVSYTHIHHHQLAFKYVFNIRKLSVVGIFAWFLRGFAWFLWVREEQEKEQKLTRLRRFLGIWFTGTYGETAMLWSSGVEERSMDYGRRSKTYEFYHQQWHPMLANGS